MEYEPEWEKRSHCRIGYWISKTILGLKWQQESEPEIDEMLHCLTDKLVESVTFKLNGCVWELKGVESSTLEQAKMGFYSFFRHTED